MLPNSIKKITQKHALNLKTFPRHHKESSLFRVMETEVRLQGTGEWMEEGSGDSS